MSLLKKIAAQLPPGLIRQIGALQFKLPFLRPLIQRLAAQAVAGEGIIQRGAGAGLKFDATGGFPGYLLGTTEPEEQDALVRHLKPDGVFYDIGANIGFYAVIAARTVGPKGHVYAFEPFPESVRAIEGNVRRNGFDNVTVIAKAVSDTSESVYLNLSHDTATIKTGTQASDARSVKVDAVTVDELVEGGTLRPPTVVMIDVEGAEIRVLDGMRRVMAQYRPVVLCEVHWLRDEFVALENGYFREIGYRITKLDGTPIPNEPVRYHALIQPIHGA